MLVRFKQTGDTIIEVLIAIAIVGVVLAGAYTVANKSSIQIRDAQERGEAQKFAAEIVERLRNNAKNNPTAYTTGSQRFCIVTTNNGGFNANDRIVILTALPVINAPASAYQSACNKQNSPIGYNSIIERNLSNPTIFTVYVRWAALGGGFNEVRYEYGIEL